MATAIQKYVHEPSLELKAAAHALVNAMQEAFNAKDATALARNLADDASWTNALGVRVRGRQEIEKLARVMMVRNRSNFARYEIIDVLPVRADVGVVNLLQVPTDARGQDLPEPGAAPIYVIAREANGWKIVASQNTLVLSPEGA
jgi:uncharacterized protein (TIGR02246 family)